MRRRLVSFCAVLLCGIFSVTCLVPAAAAFSNLDNMGIDPWGDLEGVKNPVITDTPADSYLPESSEQEEFEDVEGGVSTFSLNDDDFTRTYKLSGNIRWGFTSSKYSTLTSFNQSFTATNGTTALAFGRYEPDSTKRNTGYLRVSSGTYVDFTANVSYAAGEYSEILLTSAGQFYLAVTNSGGITSYPDEMVVLVNGQEFGEIISASEGFSFSNLSLPVDEDITTLGYRFFWNVTQTYSNTSSGSWTSRSLMAYITDGGTFVVTVEPDEPEYNGLLGTVIGWLQSLWNAITGLPSAIVNGLLDGLSGLFVPTEEEITEMKDQYSTLLSERLGFIYQAYEWTISSAEEIVSTMEAQEEYSFTFPGISIPYQGQTLTILPEQPVIMENAVMDVLRPVLGTIISLVSVAAFAHTAFDMVTALISGVSYFGFLKGKRGGNDE